MFKLVLAHVGMFTPSFVFWVIVANLRCLSLLVTHVRLKCVYLDQGHHAVFQRLAIVSAALMPGGPTNSEELGFDDVPHMEHPAPKLQWDVS